MKRGYEPTRVERIARTLYTATREDGVASWAHLTKAAQWDGTAARVVADWHALAIAALDLTYGARARLGG